VESGSEVNAKGEEDKVNNKKGTHIMFKIVKICLILFVLSLTVYCSSIPETHYYLIDYPVTGIEENSNPVYNIILGVTKFNVDPLYSDGRLVYRENPYEAKYYNYHRWITEPGKMVTDKTIDQLSASNLFKMVVLFPRISQCDYILIGNIKALEEWDEKKQWFANVKIDFKLLDKKSHKLIWKKTVEKQNPVIKKSPFEVVTGINECVRLCVEEIQQELNSYFSGMK